MAVALPRWRARASVSPGPTIQRCSIGNWVCPCYQQIARAGHTPCAEGRWLFSATTPFYVRHRDLGIGTSEQKPFSAKSLNSPEFPMTASWTSQEIDDAQPKFC